MAPIVVLVRPEADDPSITGEEIHRMPWVAWVALVGALACAGLPPLNGFVSEWLLLQALIHGLPAAGVSTAIVMPVAVAAVALTAGLAVATHHP